MRWTGIGLVLAVLALGPFFNGLFFWTELLFAQALVALGFLLWAAGRMRDRKPIGIPGGSVGKALLVLGLCYLVLLPVARYPRGDLDWVMRTFIAWLVFVMMRQEGTPGMRRTFGWIVVASMTGVAVMGLLQYTGYFTRDPAMVQSLSLVNLGSRLSSTMQYPNTEAIMFLMALVLAVGLGAERPRATILAPASLAANLLFLAFFFALSRGAVLVFPIVLLMLFVGLPKGTRWATLMTLGVAIVPGIVALRGIGANAAIHNYVSAWRWIGASGIASSVGGIVAAWLLAMPRKRQYASAGALATLIFVVVLVRIVPAMSTGMQLGIAGLLPKQATRLLDINFRTMNVRLRLNATEDAMRILAIRPWGSGGWGWDRSYREIQQFNYVMRETHNHYAQTAVEAGVIGVLALVAALFGAVRSGWRNRKSPLVWSTTVALAAVAGHSLIDFDLSYGAVWLILWSACAMASAAWAGAKETSRAPAVPRQSMQLERLVAHPRPVLAAVCLLLVGSVMLGSASRLGDVAAAWTNARNSEAALPAARVARVLDPLNSDIARTLARAMQRSGDIEGGLRTYRVATRIDEFYPLNWAELGGSLAANGQFDGGAKAQREALDLQPMLESNYACLAKTLSTELEQHLVAGERQKAMTMAEEIVGLGRKLGTASAEAATHESQWAPPQWTSLLRYANGQGLFLTGDLAAAKENLELAAKEPAMATQAEVWLYALYEQTGLTEDAQALESRPWIRSRNLNQVFLAIEHWRQ